MKKAIGILLALLLAVLPFASLAEDAAAEEEPAAFRISLKLDINDEAAQQCDIPGYDAFARYAGLLNNLDIAIIVQPTGNGMQFAMDAALKQLPLANVTLAAEADGLYIRSSLLKETVVIRSLEDVPVIAGKLLSYLTSRELIPEETAQHIQSILPLLSTISLLETTEEAQAAPAAAEEAAQSALDEQFDSIPLTEEELKALGAMAGGRSVLNKEKLISSVEELYQQLDTIPGLTDGINRMATKLTGNPDFDLHKVMMAEAESVTDGERLSYSSYTSAHDEIKLHSTGDWKVFSMSSDETLEMKTLSVISQKYSSIELRNGQVLTFSVGSRASLMEGSTLLKLALTRTSAEGETVTIASVEASAKGDQANVQAAVNMHGIQFNMEQERVNTSETDSTVTTCTRYQDKNTEWSNRSTTTVVTAENGQKLTTQVVEDSRFTRPLTLTEFINETPDASDDAAGIIECFYGEDQLYTITAVAESLSEAQPSIVTLEAADMAQMDQAAFDSTMDTIFQSIALLGVKLFFITLF